MRPHVLAFLFACGGSNADLRAQVEAADKAETSQKVQTQRLEIDAAQLVEEYDAAARAFEDASSKFSLATQRASNAAEDNASAERSYAEAERYWRWMAYVVLAAAAWDMAGEICAGVETTQQYRRRVGLVGNGRVCVDHSFAHALGGINHPWNYMPLDCSLNSSYGASFWGKFVDMPIPVLQGLLVSALGRIRCGSMAKAWSR